VGEGTGRRDSDGDGQSAVIAGAGGGNATVDCGALASAVEFGRERRHMAENGSLPATLSALSLRGLGDRLDELTGLLVLAEGDVGLGDDADEPTVLDNG